MQSFHYTSLLGECVCWVLMIINGHWALMTYRLMERNRSVALSTSNFWNRTRASPVRRPRLTTWPMIHAFIKQVNVTVTRCIRFRQYLIWISTEFTTCYITACRVLMRSLKINVFRLVSTALLQVFRRTERYSKHRHCRWSTVIHFLRNKQISDVYLSN